MVNVSATRMDTVATVNLDTQAPNVNMTLMNVKQTMTIPVSITVKILQVHTTAAAVYKLDTFRCIDITECASVKCKMGQSYTPLPSFAHPTLTVVPLGIRLRLWPSQSKKFD